MVKFILSSFLSLQCLTLYGADRVKVEVSSKVEKDHLNVNFKVASSDSLKLNVNAPWKLKLGDKSSDDFEKTTFTRADFRKELPGFSIVSKKLSKKTLARSIPYELTAYSCTSDGSQCFHDVLKGEFPITSGK